MRKRCPEYLDPESSKSSVLVREEPDEDEDEDEDDDGEEDDDDNEDDDEGYSE
jgi:hypothetical protein